MADEQHLHRYESSLLLKDGREVFIRPVIPDDVQLLVGLFNEMSPQSRYLRFMTHIRELSAELLHTFTHLDYHSSFALACLTGEGEQAQIIAVARYSLGNGDRIADLAVAVRDDWQHLGIGKALLAKIISIGGEHGISRFGSMMDPENEIMKKTLQDLGYRVRYFFRDGSYQVEIETPS